MNKQNKTTTIHLNINDLLHPKIPQTRCNNQETLDAIAKIENLEEEIRDDLSANYPGICDGMLGFCHFYWSTKKAILKNKYGIEWFSPAEENPNVFYD